LAAASGIPVFLCDPYLPSTADLRRFSQVDLDRIAAERNGRSRQILGFKTPWQAVTRVLP
jgi:IS30 family transposase